MILLDTTILAETMQPAPNPAVVAWLDRQRRSDLCLAAPALAEVMMDLAPFPLDQRVVFARALAEAAGRLFQGRTLPFDAAAATALGGFDLQTRTMPYPAMIAAIALVHGAVVATGRLVAFDFPGLKLIDPFRGLRVASGRAP